MKMSETKTKKQTVSSIAVYLMALILLCYPLRHAVRGLDLMDAGYALGNYRYFDTLNQTWKLATYLANVTGILLSKLPFGDCWIGMNVYCGLLIGAAAAWFYLFFCRRYGKQIKGGIYLLFAAELAALSFCWAPNVILYHYLGYLLMAVASVLLFEAITKNNNRYFMMAGVILGLCVAVRMPNITYMTFILPVWCDCFWKRKNHMQAAGGIKNAWLSILWKRTLFCIAGYLTGLFVPLLVISVRYGMAAYPEMIGSLFGMTDDAADYKPTSMLTAMFGDYLQYGVWLLLFAGYMAAGMLFFGLLGKWVKSKTKVTNVFKILYVSGFLIVLRFCYGRGMFNFDYRDYFSMYKWGTVYLLLVILLCVWCLAYKTVSAEWKLWAVFLLVTIFVTPLGSNNGLYPIVNNLFLTAPVSVLMLSEVFRHSRSFSGGYALRVVMGAVLVCTAVQGVLFGVVFVFHDSGSQSSQAKLSLQCGSAANGLITTDEKKTALEELDSYLYQNALNEKEVILYGYIPALAYAFDMQPAIFSTWADLDSNSIKVLESELNLLTLEAASQPLPVVILGRQRTEALTQEDGLVYKKLSLIKTFMEENGYVLGFQNASYLAYIVPTDE